LPTATMALKPNRRPPFTTLATRLMLMTRSTNSGWAFHSARSLLSPLSPLNAFSSRCEHSDPEFSGHYTSGELRTLELEPTLARPFGQGSDPPVIDIAAPVEGHLQNPSALGDFRDALSDQTAAL
jgi:hypothetical protein